MQPNRLGRVLGVSARVAAAKLKEQAVKGTARPGAGPSAATRPGTAGPGPAGAGATRPGTAGPGDSSAAGIVEPGRPTTAGGAQAGAAVRDPSRTVSAAAGRVKARTATNYAEGGRRVARGAGRFGGSLVKPFAHATSVLTLEITGVFFTLFTLFFVDHAWLTYKGPGWRDGHFAVYVGLAALFAWFAMSSFWRAKRKQRGQ